MDFKGRTAFITRTSRGIGKAIALDLVDWGVNVISTGKTVGGHEDLPETIVETTEEIRERDGGPIWCQLGMRDDASVQTAINETVDALGGIDFAANNADAIHMAGFEGTSSKRFDLLTNVNTRGVYATTHATLPYLHESDHAHVVTFSPPIPIHPTPGEVAYTLSKYGMTFITQSLAGELDADDVGMNAPRSVAAIESETTRHFGMGTPENQRAPQIACDAVVELFPRNLTDCTGNAFYDEELLSKAGADDSSSYAVIESSEPRPMSAQLFDPDYEY